MNLSEHQPSRVVSENGVLELDFNIGFTYSVLNGQKINIRTYNGSFPAPTLVARPGDVLRLRQINNLPHEEPGPLHDINQPHGFNTLNFHSHGLNVSPEGNEDNVLLEVTRGRPLRPKSISRLITPRAPSGITRTSTGQPPTIWATAWPVCSFW